MNPKYLKNAIFAAVQHAVLADGGEGEAAAQATQLNEVPEQKPLVIDTNPLAQDVSVQVQTSLVTMEKAKFSFRTTKIKDEAGVEKDWKRPTFETQVPLLTTAGVIAALQQGDKTTELVREAANDVILNRARGIINDKIEADAGVVLGEDTLNLEDLTLAAIAKLPKADRGAGIPKEAWIAFVKDYKEVMQTPEATALFPDKKARTAEALEKHAIVLQGKFNAVRSRQDVIKQMLGFIDVWMQVSPNSEEHLAAYEHLRAKGNALLQGETFTDL